ncbi:MAG TPA: hypothetical protein DCQ83_04770, partial [Fibrobacteres bacterium]|nr:hypothetical protein [Fibrobacterota bacterium]
VLAAIGGGFARISDYSSIGLYAVNTSGGSAKTIELHGYKGTAWTMVSESAPSSKALVDFGVGALDELEFVTGNGSAQSDGVNLYAYGTRGTSSITRTSTNAANGNTLHVGYNGAGGVDYTFKTTLTESVKATATLTISGVVVDGETVTV